MNKQWLPIKNYENKYEECLNTFRDEYINCYERTDCVMKQIVDILRENTCKPEERSMISPDYARNFICDFILGIEQECIAQKRLF